MLELDFLKEVDDVKYQIRIRLPNTFRDTVIFTAEGTAEEDSITIMWDNERLCRVLNALGLQIHGKQYDEGSADEFGKNILEHVQQKKAERAAARAADKKFWG